MWAAAIEVCDAALLMLAIRRATPDDARSCQAIVRGLPDYFTEDVPDRVAVDLAVHEAWLALEGDDPVGLVIADRRSSDAAEILWMAVDADRRGHGIGSALLDQVCGELAAGGVRLIEVKTLDPSANYEPYAATNAFWQRRGFIQIDAIDPPAGFQGPLVAIYVASLTPTR